MEYTKGEWGVNAGYPKIDDRMVVAVSPNGGVKSIAKLTLQLLPEVTEANAYLLAAAPDMYEALKGVLDDADNGSFTLLAGSVRELVEKALAKAEGRRDDSV